VFRLYFGENVIKFIKIFLCLFPFFLARANEKVIINDINWPPYFMINSEEEGSGLAKEIINLCLQRIGHQTKYHELPIKRTHHFMEVGEIDITVYSYKKEREKILHYGKEVLFNSEYGFMVRANSHIKIEELADLEPYVIGHLAGLSYTPELKKIINDKTAINEVVIGYSLTAMFAQLIADIPRFEIMADSKHTLSWEAKKLGVTDKIKILDYNIKNKSYYITVSKHSKNIKNPKELLGEIDTCLRDIKHKGEYKAIFARYGIKS
jgi:polar amino acid transport system substrate-binding protein